MDIKRFVNDFEWVHTLIGICGNTLFFVGSLLFLSEATKDIGVWTFIVGSAFMLIGSIGSAIVQLSDGQDGDADRARRQPSSTSANSSSAAPANATMLRARSESPVST